MGLNRGPESPRLRRLVLSGHFFPRDEDESAGIVRHRRTLQRGILLRPEKAGATQKGFIFVWGAGLRCASRRTSNNEPMRGLLGEFWNERGRLFGSSRCWSGLFLPLRSGAFEVSASSESVVCSQSSEKSDGLSSPAGCDGRIVALVAGTAKVTAQEPVGRAIRPGADV